MESVAQSVGLAGDGDEISAIDDVERAFGLKFNYDDASNWRTAGDLFASLQKALPETDLAEAGLWDRFALALSQETGVDPNLLTPESPLILQRHPWRIIHDKIVLIWIAGLAVIVLIGIAALLER